MSFLRKILLLASLPVGSAIACPPGTVPQQGVGWQGCAPAPGTASGPSSRSQPQEVWADRWGAIAVDTIPTGSVGFSAVTGMKRKGQTEKSALKSCREKGGKQCEIMIAYYNQCAVLMWGDRTINTSGAPSEELAKQRSLEKCNRANDTNCEIVYSGCSLPQRIK
ncbi:DUF4189 domain-containing protein [Lysobacter sp. ISL-42]|nr:DUF4189 domain-containing protein [Lysobacter sp. ISL-42]MBT2750611.1 DUF4189 domain-containing protein [Lysobacter sp. ISL-50]MBT2780952.1 DUF4189 domain-containing protein [Lysobacter sp. ISL-52]